MDLVVLSNRFSKKAGVVVNPLAKYRGKKIRAVAIMAKAAKASQATPTRALSPNTSPFKPTSCSVDKFVSNSDPATTGCKYMNKATLEDSTNQQQYLMKYRSLSLV